ncbi:hypothetical protein [Pseudoalteromonas sp. OOF1S-7]|uniref:hypothetical protein n=1 Tax=Pseudoalteromonas sp. OOF1S-7 TaxID=2917757 RepID=UPI001EF543A2|nr:hypothetical protein [Pseudoalteromonas sp. OOF1S-7]MCG7534532.1 hypothetical protein [Pseudoalteromonas sp. OOF1S-7]
MTTFNQLSTLTLLCLTLCACGGGGEGGSSGPTSTSPASSSSSTVTTPAQPAEPAPNFDPDPDRLDSAAETSNDLHVKADFNFSTIKSVTLDLGGQDVFGASLANKMVKIYALYDVVESYADQALADKALLATTRFNSAGQLTLTLDVPVNYQTLLISVDGMLQSNHLLSELTMQATTVAHQFN